MKNIYLEQLLEQVPRILGQLDKNPLSKTYGCFDRNYWKYMVRDYTNARLQEASFTLALLYSYNDTQNPYYKDQSFLKFILAAIEFWKSIQNRNGSFNEYYNSEQSHVATIFSSFAIAEIYYLLELNDLSIISSLERAASWLNKHDDLVVINHDSACVPFFNTLYKITKKKIYLSWLDIKLNKVKQNFNSEGWFKEYGGADIGYQSYSIYFLAKYYLTSKNPLVKDILTKAVSFFTYFLQPDGKFTGILGSRDTDFVIPAGFEMLLGRIKFASEISSYLRKSLSKKIIVGPYSFDNRFILEEGYVYLDFVFKNRLVLKNKLPFELKSVFMHCNDAKLLFLKKDIYYLLVNVGKSGVGKIFKKKAIFKELNFYSFKRKRNIYSTYNQSTFLLDDGLISIFSSFKKYNNLQQSFLKLFILKLFAFLGLSRIIKGILRFFLIKQRPNKSYTFKREINLKDFSVHDIIDSRVHSFVVENKDSLIYSTSVGFWNN